MAAWRKSKVAAAFRSWDTRSPAGGDRLWWPMWLAADFSWEGLADAAWDETVPTEAQKLKRWRAPVSLPLVTSVVGEGETAYKQATLQDFWRWSPGVVDPGTGVGRSSRLLTDKELVDLGLLIEVDGVLWHALHCLEVVASPPSSPANAMRIAAARRRSGVHKEIWERASEALTHDLAARLMRSSAWFGDDAPDGRVQLAGAIVSEPDALLRQFGTAGSVGERSINVAASLVWFLSDADFGGLSFGPNAQFDRVLFDCHACFKGTQFCGAARFDRSGFLGDSRFYGAQFLDDASFVGVQFNTGGAFFQRPI